MVGEVRRNAFVASMFALASCVLLPVVLLLSVSGFHVSDTAIPVALLVYSGCRLAVMIYLGEKRPLQGVFWLFVYVTLGVAPLAQVVTGLSQRVAAPDQVIWAYGLVGAGIIAYDIGSLIAKRREGHVVQDRRPHATTLNTGRLVLGSIITVGITAYNIATFGLATYFASRQENAVLVAETVGSADGHAARALVGALDTVPQLIMLLGWILVFHKQRAESGKSTFATKLWLFIFVAINLVVNNPISNSRFWVLTVLVSAFFVMPWVSSALYRVSMIGGTAAAVLAFPLLDVFRMSSERRAVYGFESRGVIENLAVKDYDQMVMIANGLWYVDDRGHHFGMQMIGNLLFWVPRAIWPDKPIDTGIEIGTAMGASNVNLSSPVWIELYLDFGILGAVAGLALLGYWSRRLDTRFIVETLTKPVTYTAIGVLVPLIAGYQFILLRGPLLQSMGRIAVMALIVWFLFTSIRKRTHASSGRSRVARPGRLRARIPATR